MRKHCRTPNIHFTVDDEVPRSVRYCFHGYLERRSSSILVLRLKNYLQLTLASHSLATVIPAGRRETVFAGRKICSRIKLSRRRLRNLPLLCSTQTKKIEDTVPHRNLVGFGRCILCSKMRMFWYPFAIN